MNTTSLSLLDRLKRAEADSADWQRLQEVYLPLVRQWLTRVSGLRDDVDDVAQEVLVVLLRELPSFERQRQGSFRAWLRLVTVNRVRAFWKDRDRHPRPEAGEAAEQILLQLEDPGSPLSRQWDLEHDQYVLQRLLAVVQPDFEPKTWQAFNRFALEGQSAADVARELDLSANAVLQAKFRVLKRLREEAGELMS